MNSNSENKKFAMCAVAPDLSPKTKTPYTYLSIYLPNKTPKPKPKTEDSKEVTW